MREAQPMSRTQAPLESKGLKDVVGWHVVKHGLKLPIQLEFAGWSTAVQPGAIA